MKAYVVDPNAPGSVRLTEVADPKPAADELVMAVEAFSLNHSELPQSALFPPPNAVPGSDSAGRVLEAAANGKGPRPGTRVVALGPGGSWAQRRAVKIANTAELPDGLDVESASTIPVAGGVALQAVRAMGAITGRRVLITGATGGVGRLALQVARLAGAEVVALTSSDAKRAELESLGASEVVTRLDALSAPLFGVIELIGGPTLVEAWDHLRAGGILVSIGGASGQPSTFPPYGTVESGKTLLGFQLGSLMRPSERFSDDFAYLARLMASGKLDPQITWRNSWSKLPEALDALANRRISGKAVLVVD